MRDTLIVLPTIGKNVDAAIRVLASVDSYTRLVVLDDASEDDARRIYKVAESIEPSAERRGLVRAYRRGFNYFARRHRFTHLVLLEDGLTLTPGWDTIMRRTLDAHPEFGWVACGQLENEHAPFTSLCSMLTREAALSLDGGPDPLFSPCHFDDGDMMLRLLAAGFTPHAVAHKVSHPESMTATNDADRPASLELLQKHRQLFMARWGMGDMYWDAVPVHQPCGVCR